MARDLIPSRYVKGKKMKKAQKEMRKSLKAALKNAGGAVFSFPAQRVTVAVCPAIKGGNATFAHVSIAHCSEGDTFKRKFGELVALERMAENVVISARINRDICAPLYFIASEIAECVS